MLAMRVLQGLVVLVAQEAYQETRPVAPQPLILQVHLGEELQEVLLVDPE
jgi:hypothetical protein